LKIFEIVFSFLDPSKAMAQISAETKEEAVEKLMDEIATHASTIKDVEVLLVQEVLNDPSFEEEDLDADRTLN